MLPLSIAPPLSSPFSRPFLLANRSGLRPHSLPLDRDFPPHPRSTRRHFRRIRHNPASWGNVGSLSLNWFLPVGSHRDPAKNGIPIHRRRGCTATAHHWFPRLPALIVRMPHPPTPTTLPELWRALAVQQRLLGADAQARTLDYCADELTAAMLRAGDELLNLGRASEESGYSTDHLARLLREGKIPNSGRKSKPLIRRRDLPQKSRKRKEESCVKDRGGNVPDRLFRDIIHSKFGGDDAQD